MKAEALPRPAIATLGNIFQLAFVPADLDRALHYWTRVMGVGPFFRRSRLNFPGTRYMGKPSDIEFSVLIGYWGDTQIELIEQHNDAPSIYRAWPQAGHEGLHHSCIEVADIDAARHACEAAGLAVVQDLGWPGGGAIYVDGGGGPGTLLELVQLNEDGRARFRHYREAARGWDGSDPLRDI